MFSHAYTVESPAAPSVLQWLGLPQWLVLPMARKKITLFFCAIHLLPLPALLAHH
jgi:hypothetical protein